jgi:hypothetical protein
MKQGIGIPLSVGAIFALGGCQGMVDAVVKDPVRVETVTAKKDPVTAAIALDADKRNVIVVLRGDHAGMFCAEPPPDVVRALDTKTKGSFGGGAKNGEMQSAELKAEYERTLAEAATVLSRRNPELEVYRTGTYALCQFFANGAIGRDDLVMLFRQLTESVLEAMGPGEDNP